MINFMNEKYNFKKNVFIYVKIIYVISYMNHSCMYVKN